jgi:hydroxymethylpyrimidine/phosphomethylpyrimidine kinase
MATSTALTIAGSDSSGGAGIQADLRTMAAFGVFGTTAITSVTVQNTMRVESAQHLPASLVAAQIDAVMQDVGADAAKTGMLPTAEVIEVVADRIRAHRIARLVVDPVMVATSGGRLMEGGALDSLVRHLVPLAAVVTPNLAETAALSGVAGTSEADLERAARVIHAMGPRNVLIKGGHAAGECTDILFDGRRFERFAAPRLGRGPVHGAGCTLSAAIAAGLALGWELVPAVQRAKAFVTTAIASALDLGGGSAIVNTLVRPEE